MVILPIRNFDKNKNGRIMNVKIMPKEAKKVKSNVRLVDVGESEILSNGRKYSESTYCAKRQEPNVVVDFIRNTSLSTDNEFLLTTRESSDTTTYDVYAIKQPQNKVSDGLDNLFGEVITNMRIEVPDQKKPKYISLKDLGIGDDLTDEKFIKLQSIINKYPREDWKDVFKAEGIIDYEQAIEFVNTFDCTVVNYSTISEDELTSMISSFEMFNAPEGKKLKNYYKKALENEEIYAKLTYINRIINNEPLKLIKNEKHSKEKELQYIKKDNKKIA